MLFSSLKTQILLIALVTANGFLAPIAVTTYWSNHEASASEKPQKTPSITKKVRVADWNTNETINKIV